MARKWVDPNFRISDAAREADNRVSMGYVWLQAYAVGLMVAAFALAKLGLRTVGLIVLIVGFVIAMVWNFRLYLARRRSIATIVDERNAWNADHPRG